MKHAYLILAHNQFEVTKRLLQAIDHTQNDIYIHFDKKLAVIPEFKFEHSNIYILQDRIDVAWGDFSVVEAEYKLFELASNTNHYQYYHLLSGVDMLLKPNDQILNFFNDNFGKQFIGFSNYDYTNEVYRKVNLYHLYPRYFKNKSSFRKVARAIYLRFQMLLKMHRNKQHTFKKGTQWVSVTHEFVKYLLQNKSRVYSIYKNTFCPDEIYKHTLCWNSPFRDDIYDLNNESVSSQRYIGWKNGELFDWTNNDYEELVNCNLIFARKFNQDNLEVVDKLLSSITDGNKGGTCE